MEDRKIETKVAMPVFDGEASETDSEENVHISLHKNNIPLNDTNKVQCLEITGEDAESDSDEKNTQSVCRIAANQTISKERIDEKNSHVRSQSLLHHKLRESNSIFYNDLGDVIKDFARDNEKSLTDIDQHIFNSQTILQGAATSLKNFHSESIILRNKLETLLTSNFLSNVKTI